MKILITILALVTGVFGILITGNADPHRSCSCSGLSCNCTVTCKDEGEIPNCTCSYFSCSCICNPKDIATESEPPKMDKDNERNSERIEGYFRGLGTASGTQIADYVKTLRNAVHSSDGKTYYQTASRVELAYSQLPAAQQNAFENWVNSSLR